MAQRFEIERPLEANQREAVARHLRARMSETPSTDARPRSMTRPARRPGFILPWVILTVAIVAVLAAAVASQVATLLDRSRMASVARQMHMLAAEVDTFRIRVGNYPGRLSQLSNAITTSDRNSCHQTMTSTNVSNWTSTGPFVGFLLDQRGVLTQIGRVNDSIPTRATSGTPPVVVDIPGVRSADALMLDAYIDGATGDTVTYNAVVNDTTTVHYRLLSSSAVVANHC